MPEENFQEEENLIEQKEEKPEKIKKEFRVPGAENNINVVNLVYIFVVALVFGIVFISIMLKSVSPNIDLDNGDEHVASMNQRGDENEEEYDSIRSQIDQRLKMIQNEEEMPGVSDRGYESDEEIVERLRRNEEQTKKIEVEKVTKEDAEKRNNVKVEPVSIPTVEAPKPNTISKIYIGQYSDMQKAIEMQNNIINSGLTVTPVIKEVNGYYTIQAGAFTNYDSAKNLAIQLENAGFSAKIVKEIR